VKGAQQEYMNIFRGHIGEVPFRYLGIPIYYTRLFNKDRKLIEERFERKLSTYKSKMLSYGGKLTLISSVLSNLSMYMISFFAFPKEVLQKLDYLGLGYFGMGMDTKENID